MLYLKTLSSVLLLVLFGISTSLQAQSTWTGEAGSNWSDPGNWNTPPQNGDDLIFPGTIPEGERTLNNNGALSSAGNITITGSGWVFQGSSLTLNGGTIAFGAYNQDTSGGEITWASDLIIASGTQFFNAHGSSKFVDITGLISGAGSVRFHQSSAGMQGTIRFSNTGNSFTGSFAMRGGRAEIVSLANQGVNSSIGAGTSIVLGASTASANQFQFAYVGAGNASTDRTLNLQPGGNLQINIHNDSSNNGNLSFTNTAAISVSNATESHDRMVTFKGTSTGITTLDGQLVNRWIGIRVMDNAGIVRLTGDNSYHNETQVTGGTLWIDGDQSGSLGDVIVGVAGVLGGNGIVGGETFVSGAIAPGGESIRTLTVANHLTWNGTAEGSVADWQFRLGESDVSDRLAISGAGHDFNKGTGEVFQFDFLGTGEIGIYTLITWTGDTEFEASDFSYTNLAAGLAGQFSIEDTHLIFTVAIPEPSTYVLGLGMLALLVLWVRRVRADR